MGLWVRAAAALVCVWTLLGATPAAAKDVCKGVDIEADPFGGRFWALKLNLGTVTLFRIDIRASDYLLHVLAADSLLTTRTAPAGSIAELAFEDGTVLRHKLTAPIAGTVLINATGTSWEIPVPLRRDDLARVAASPLVGARIVVGDAIFGSARNTTPQWSAKLQDAAACILSLDAPAASGAAPAAPPPAAPASSGRSASAAASAPSPAPAPADPAAPAPAPANGSSSGGGAGVGVGENMFGGRVVSRHQLYGTVGYPDTELGVRLHLGDRFDLAPNVRFAYAKGFAAPVPSLALGVDARIQVLDQDGFVGAIILREPITFGFGAYAPLSVGIGLLHPGFLVTYTIEDRVDLDFGLQFHADVVITSGNAVFEGSVPLIFGAELEVAPQLQVGARLEGGPWFATTPGRAAVSGEVRFVAGVGWAF